MKKLFALLLTLVFVFAFSACSNKGKNAKGQNNNPTSTTQPDTEQKDNIQSQNNQTQSNGDLITRDRAIELALNHVRLTVADVRDLEAELDRERVGIYWEVDFESGGFEYSYDINAETEEVFRLEKDRD